MKTTMNKRCMLLLLVTLLCATAQAQETLQDVKIASSGHFVNFLPLDLAIARGYFEDEGLRPELVILRGGTLTAIALISGQVDFSINSIAHVLKAADKGNGSLRMVCLLNETPGVLLVVDSKYKGTVNTIADLKGMKLGVTSLGSATHMVLAYLLERNSVSLEDVEIVKAGSSTFPAALKNKSIDAGIAGEPLASMMVERGEAFVLKRLVSPKETHEAFGGPYNFLGLLTRQDQIDSDPELVRKVVKVHTRALEWISAHSAEEIAAALPSKVVGADRDAYARTLTLMKEFFSIDGSMSVEGAENVLSSMKFSGIFDLTRTFNVQDYLEDRFLMAAAASQPAFNQKPGPPVGSQNPGSDRLWVYVILAALLVAAAGATIVWKNRHNAQRR